MPKSLINCVCQTHSIEIEFDSEYPQGMDLCFWRYGHRGTSNWWGHPYTNMVSLDKKTLHNLIKQLQVVEKKMK